METSQKILPMLFKGDWTTSLDLQDAYYHVALRLWHMNFFRFACSQEPQQRWAALCPQGGQARWYKEQGGGLTLIYSDGRNGGPLPRVSRLAPGSYRNCSIIIHDTSTVDTGVYYCVKYETEAFTETEHKSTIGTVLSVTASPSPPVIFGPGSKVEIGDSAAFTCTSEGFLPEYIHVTWMKDGDVIWGSKTTELVRESMSFRLNSTVELTLGKEDLKSNVTCWITHDTLESPLTATMSLGDVLRETAGASGVRKLSLALWIGLLVEKLCLVLFIFGFIYLKQRQ
ncbi:tyrosine-protein phosphatase non-receptor type substrate 1-like [Ambystoma mexicanum]|uniref:tyrosine-protein phosphatase non-receptor type substrate 1-like n=1 Tax=Ambystoma mexicanum TaxID=8296 RepID=UPI0037E83E6A